MAKRTWANIEPHLYRIQYGTEKRGSYFAIYSHNGRSVQESLRTENLMEARRLLKIRRGEDDSIDQGQRSRTLAAAADKWLETRSGGSASTLKNDRLFAARIKAEWPHQANVPIKNIQASDVLSFISKLKKKNGSDPVSNSYRNHFGWTLRAIFDLCVKDKVRADNPASGFAGKADKDILRPTPSREQFEEIVKTIRKRRFSDTATASADLVEFMGLGGVGLAECAGLQWGDVDLKKGEIHLLRRKTGKSFTIKVYPKLRPFMERMRKEAVDLSAGAKVFTIRDPKKALQHACEDLKFPNFTSKAFRRMFIMIALEAGVDVGIVAKTQGHTDGGALILRVYRRHVRGKFEDQQLELLK